tara:strand:- start:104 stop:382 length:279 start_codon:yes stop_codon:yes gene_type:complete
MQHSWPVGVLGRIVVVRDSLFLRGTFKTGDGTRKDRKICLDLPAHNGQLLEAENRFISLADIIASTGIVPTFLPWQTKQSRQQLRLQKKQLF